MRHLKTLYVQVLIAIVLGIVVGAVWKDSPSLKILGDLFVRAIKMVIAPVIFCTVTAGIAHMGDLKRVGRLGVKTLVYFEVVSTFALVIGLGVALIVRPGEGFSHASSAVDVAKATGYMTQAKAQTPTDFFLHLIPESFVGAFTGGDLVPVVLLACLTGFALLTLGQKGHDIAEQLHKAAEVFFAIIGIVVRFAPIGAFGAMAFTVGSFGLKSLLNLAYLIGTFYGTSVLFVVLILGLVARITGFSIFRFLAYIKEELLIVLGASSSEAALPQLMAKMQKLGVSKATVGLVVPTGYSFNLDGTNIYMTLATLFLAQATHASLTPVQIATLLVVAMITSKGASGVTGAGFITLAATLSAVPSIPVTALALLVGVDRFMSECRALTNTVGNGVACLAIAKWEGELDSELLKEQLTG